MTGDHPNRLLRWQILTVTLLVLGYAGFYLCRSNFSVALPLIVEELAARGLSADEAKVRLGMLASLGVFAYALGKFLSGGLTDLFGGRRAFLLGTIGTVCCTALFALGGGFPVFTLAWVLNRLLQSMGWPGAVKLASRWFSYSSYGAAMGFISLSYLFGDAAARQFMGWLIGHGVRWRGVFFAAASVMLTILVVNLLLLKESPRDIGEVEPKDNPFNLAAVSEISGRVTIKSMLTAFLRNPAFLIVCALSLGCTLLRETFNTWTPTYFTEVVGLSKADAAGKSALFPLFGGISVLLAGFISDRLGRNGRALIILVGLMLSSVGLGLLGHAQFGGSHALPVYLVAAVAFTLIGPYSYLAGAISLDFGGKQGSATASGIIDGVGYLGGVLAGGAVARVSVSYGWQGAFTALAGVALLSSLAAALFLVEQRRTVKTKIATEAT
ncbi:MAG: MFS transporter [Acidobacteria bacterium]|nr:MFS transporter [Acidobacteriota bacterium]